MSAALIMAGIISLTAPNGTEVHVMRETIFSVRAAVPGDHPAARSVIQSVLGSTQSVRETPDDVLARISVSRCGPSQN